jgi:2-keto-4-pentenoate hydratase/2-oxohepta-3-ene-1,7-dioic acid hydratase in catechol pathway
MTTEVLRPSQFNRVICLGKNYTEHAVEFASFADERDVVPEHPIVFSKPTSALCGATDDIEVDAALASALDYEVELGVVIGTRGFRIAPDDVDRFIGGYTVVNDISARDLQTRHNQWFLGKSLYRATPVGPRIVAAADLGELDSLTIECRVNGEVRQRATLGQMIFDIHTSLSLISQVTPLEPGDLIAMGTPSGVGVGFTPPRYLADGDRVLCEIEGIGQLHNTIRVRPDHSAGSTSTTTTTERALA